MNVPANKRREAQYSTMQPGTGRGPIADSIDAVTYVPCMSASLTPYGVL
jgi:hypothetical protein